MKLHHQIFSLESEPTLLYDGFLTYAYQLIKETHRRFIFINKRIKTYHACALEGDVPLLHSPNCGVQCSHLLASWYEEASSFLKPAIVDLKANLWVSEKNFNVK